MTHFTGFGQSSWGSYSFGGNPNQTFSLLQVKAIAENIVRLTFNQKIFFTGIGEVQDASKIEKYLIGGNPLSRDLQGKIPREVKVLYAFLDSTGFSLDLTLDRFLSSYPAIYACNIQHVFNEAKTAEIISETLLFYGMQLQENNFDLLTPHGSRDIANPTFVKRDINNLIASSSDYHLGAFAFDETGDVAFDEGVANLKKRILRRLLTQRGGFVHLPDYGVGLFSLGKKLARLSTINRIVTEAEKQIKQEPEVQSVAISFLQDSVKPNLFYLSLKAKTKTGQDFSLKVPVKS